MNVIVDVVAKCMEVAIIEQVAAAIVVVVAVFITNIEVRR